MPPLRFARVETSLGPMWVAETDRGVAAVDRAPSLDAFLEALRRRFPDADPAPADLDAAWLQDALSGGSLPAVDVLGLSDFDTRVYAAVRSVPAGETITYGEVAALVGSPGAARAVGGAMSRCPLFPAVPCHRVVRASDGWSGWGGDDQLKRRLLRQEAGARSRVVDTSGFSPPER
jgi:AraC family transcriptional regulator of adaptative response/methylated-DNA-[protein]-cysteine methyltransferase